MKINPANIISVFRVIMVFVAVYFLLEVPTSFGKIFALTIISFAVLLDAVDGKIARKFGFEGEVGKLTDLYADHMVANIIWVSLAFLGLVSPWIPLIATTRDMAVDFFRQVVAAATGLNGFQQVAEVSTGWLSGSRPMRFGYGFLKLVAWAAALSLFYFPVHTAVSCLVWLTLFVCLLRAIPAFQAGWRHVVFSGE